jgi:hypothetical protein
VSLNSKWVAEAAHTALAERLAELSTHRDKAVRAAVAENPSTPTDVLETLVRDKHHLVRFGVAQNPDPRSWGVALRAQDAGVRVVLAQRHDLDEGTLAALMNDPDRRVRESLCDSSRREDVLGHLAHDEDHHVRASAATNTALSEEALERLAADRVTQVRAVAAQSPRLSHETVSRLAGDRSGNVRYFVLEANPDRVDIAERLKNDEEADIARLARARLNLDSDEARGYA